VRIDPRTAWLSLTPEPERELPELLAALHAGVAAHVEDERHRLTARVVRGSERSWRRYLDRVAARALAVAHGGAGDRGVALELARLVLDHDRMLIGLPGRGYARTAARRRALAAAIRELECAGRA
jgi:hypothetical protein